MSNDQGPSESLSSMLVVERRGENQFTARLESFWGASMSCDAVARAALAAGDTCPGKRLHALQGHFIEPVPPGVSIALRVERLADGDRWARRRVQLRLDGRLLCDVTLSFAAEAPGLSYQGAEIDADAGDPERTPSTAERAEAEGWGDFARGPIEFRRLGPSWPWPVPSSAESSVHREWVCPRRPLPSDPRIQTGALVFLAGFYSHWTASDRLGADFRPDRFEDVSHAVWVHRHVPWDGWWLLHAASEVGHAGRLFTRRQLFTRSGVLVASTALEGAYTWG